MDVVFYNINLANGCQRAAMSHAARARTRTHTHAVNPGNFLMVDINTNAKNLQPLQTPVLMQGAKMKPYISK